MWIHGDTAEVLERVSAAVVGSNNVYLVTIDRRGWLWVGTGDAVSVSNGQRWIHFAAEDGLVWNGSLDSQRMVPKPDLLGSIMLSAPTSSTATGINSKLPVPWAFPGTRPARTMRGH